MILVRSDKVPAFLGNLHGNEELMALCLYLDKREFSLCENSYGGVV